MARRPTPSESSLAGPGDAVPAVDGPAEPFRGAAQDTELSRLDNRSLAIIGLAVALSWTLPPVIGFAVGPTPPGAEPLQIAYMVAVGLALVCAAAAAVVAWQALRIRPLATDEAETAVANGRDAVDDKRDSTTRAAGILVASLILSLVGHAFGAAATVTGGGTFF